MSRSYLELLTYNTLEERFNYLNLEGSVGCETFGSRRWMNQSFYRSREWKDVRNAVMIRDSIGGHVCDLGIEDFPIFDRPIIHHINPLTQDDIEQRRPCCLDLNNLITTTHNTHNAIHYGDAKLLPQIWVERTPDDHIDW